MHVLFIPGWYPHRLHPTLGNFVKRHAEAVATRHRVTVVHSVAEAGLKRRELVNQDQGGLSEHLIYVPAGSLQAARRHIAIMSHVQDLLKEGVRFDVVHGNILHSTAYILLALHRRLKIPFLISENWTGYHLGPAAHIPLPTRWAMRRAAKKAGRLCPVSLHLAAAMKRFGLEGRITVVPNVVDLDLFHPRTDNRPDGPYRFIHVSTLADEHKNVSGMLRAFHKAHAKVPQMRLHILGDGDRTPHERLAAELGLLHGQVTFEGMSAPATVAERMRASDALVLPSNHENLPCVMLEAFATGMPVLATDVGGIPEHLTPERGIMISRGDMDALEQGMQDLATGSHRTIAKDIRLYAERFGVERVALDFEEAYHSILPRRSRIRGR